jgi:signal peptidase I
VADSIGLELCAAMIVTSALMSWKSLMLATGSESPVVVVLSGSMEPSFFRGDILFLKMGTAPVRTGEIVVYNADDKAIPIVHRIIQIHERREINYVDILTKACFSATSASLNS